MIAKPRAQSAGAPWLQATEPTGGRCHARIFGSAILLLGSASMATAASRYPLPLSLEWRYDIGAAPLSFILFLAILVLLLVLASRGQVRAGKSHDIARLPARHDVLTGLPNCRSFTEEVAARLNQPSRYGEKVAIIELALADIGIANDRFGHACGNELLRMAASRLRAALSADAFLARIRGDVFAVVRSDVLIDEAAAALAATFDRPFETSAGDVRVSAKLGVALALGRESDPDSLIRHADLALYRARESRVTQIAFYDPVMSDVASRYAELRAAIAEAVAGDLFAAEYQPIFDTRNHNIVGCEVLLRWSHPHYGPIPPATFIPILEDTGWIVTVGERLLRRAAREAAFWPQTVRVAVNISPLQCRAPTFVEVVRSVLLETGLDPGRLDFEITRSIAGDDDGATIDILKQLQSLGVLITFDNFGSGCAPMADLIRLPFDRLKIDKSLIAGMEQGSQAHILVGAAIEMAGRLGMAVTAEGVETERQAQLLRAMLCPELQGYLLGRPMEPRPLLRFIRARETLSDLRQGRQIA